MIVSLTEQLSAAKKGKYAVGLFNVVSLEMLRGVFCAARDTHSPLIIGCAENMTKSISLKELISVALPMADSADFPVTLHLDHAHSVDTIKEAISLGFNSVMYDCSHLPFDENTSKLKELTSYAHAHNVCVEAELGSVTGVEGEEYAGDTAGIFTPPKKAKEYIEKTGADALAISIGNAHGAYSGKPKLHFDILKEISYLVSVPLVLHGGSGIPEADFKRAISMGISKVNIFTDINKAAAKAAHDNYTEGCGYARLIPYIEKAVYKAACERMNFFKNR